MISLTVDDLGIEPQLSSRLRTVELTFEGDGSLVP